MSNMRAPLLSIIIPVYNADRFIGKCLDSLICQFDAAEVEIVCVNDGSEDRSGVILATYVGQYASLIVETQENQGVSAARNAGIRRASGHYVMFVDGDDWLCADAAENLLPILRSLQYDCVFFGLRESGAPGDEPCAESRSIEGVKGGPDDVAAAILGFQSPFQGYAPGKVIRRSILLAGPSIMFDERVSILEDEWFWINASCRCERAFILNESFYVYRRRQGSLSSGLNEDRSRQELCMRRRVHKYVRIHYPRQERLARGRAAQCVAGLVRYYYVYEDNASLRSIRSAWKAYPGSTLLLLPGVPVGRKVSVLLCDAAMALHVSPILLKPLRSLLSEGMPEQ